MSDRSPLLRAVFVLTMLVLAAGILALPELLRPAAQPPGTPAATGAAGAEPQDTQTAVREPVAGAPAAPRSRDGVVAGRVLDGLGLPVSGCEIVLMPMLERPTLDPDQTASGAATSDGNGRFQVRHPGGTSLSLMLRHPDFPATPGAQGLELSPGASIELGDLVLHSQPGLVVRTQSATSGLPIAGAQVELEPMLEDAFLPDAVRALRRRALRSAADGSAVIYGLRGGQYWLRVTAADHAAIELLHSQPEAGARSPDRIVKLSPGASLRGSVHDARGAPVAGALLRAEPLPTGAPALPTRTDADGGFLIPNLERRPHRLTVESRSHGQLIREPVEVGAAAIAIQMPAGLSIRGRVLSDNVPVSEARIEALPDAGWPIVVDGAVFRPAANTDGEGRFEIRGLPEGRFLLRVESKGYAPPEPFPVEAGAAPITLNLRPAGQLAGKVLDSGGRPLGGAQIEVLRSDDDGTSFTTLLDRVVHGREPLPQAETGRGGRFLISGIAPASYRLRIRADEHAPWVTDPFQVPAGRSLTLPTVTLQRGAVVSGRTLRADRSAAAGAVVVADPGPENRPGTPGAEGTSDADGSYSLGPLAPGSYELFYYFPKGQTAAEAAESRRSTMTRVQLSPGARVLRNLIHR